ncbi:MAG: LysE family translocator [Burkholderiaceae bacterium]
MSEVHDLGLFVLSGLLLNLVPGPDSLLVVSRSATEGFRSGSSAALGIGTGTLVHIAAAALGLSALLAASATAFTILKLLGAAYLCYLGLALLCSRRAAVVQELGASVARSGLSYRRSFIQGFWTNVLNPKVALFFLAFVPQFITPDAPHKALPFMALGFIFDLNGMIWCHVLALVAAFARERMTAVSRLGGLLNRWVGALFLGLGIRLALSART